MARDVKISNGLCNVSRESREECVTHLCFLGPPFLIVYFMKILDIVFATTYKSLVSSCCGLPGSKHESIIFVAE